MRHTDEGGEEGSQDEVDEKGLICIGPFRFEGFVSPQLRRRIRHLYRNFKGRVETLRIQNGRMQELMPIQAIQAAHSYSLENLEQLYLCNNKLHQTHFLQKCMFPNLQVINLSRNRLHNLSQLWNGLHFPYLEELHLHNNHINSLRSIKRWRFLQLYKLTLDLNFIIDIHELSQADLPALRELQIYSNLAVDIRPLFKTAFPNLQTIQAHQNCISDSLLTFRVLSTKYPSLQPGSMRV